MEGLNPPGFLYQQLSFQIASFSTSFRYRRPASLCRTTKSRTKRSCLIDTYPPSPSSSPTFEKQYTYTTATMINILIAYWIFPAFSSIVWLAMLLGLLLNWTSEGSPHLPSMEAGQTIAYISDTGAYSLKPLFIAGSVVTVVCLDIGFLAERWLRHTGRLSKNTSRTQKALSLLSILFALIGAAGLILLSIQDTYHHPRVHDVGLGLFILGYIVSAIFLCAEKQRLGIHYREHRILAISFWIKLFFIFTEVILAIVFISTTSTHNRNVAAVFEWVIALIFTFYDLSFVLDLLPSVRTNKHIPQGHKDQILEQGGQRLSTSSTTYEQNVAESTLAHKEGVPAGAPQPSTGLRRYFTNLR